MVLERPLSLSLCSWGEWLFFFVLVQSQSGRRSCRILTLFYTYSGGIYTKAADVGADMVGKIEQSIPEDDPRNPATIADLVGDMVGDCVGSSADVFESVAAEIIGAMILGSTVATESGMSDKEAARFVFFPLIVHAMDIIVSTVGISVVSIRKDTADADPMKALQR